MSKNLMSSFELEKLQCEIDKATNYESTIPLALKILEETGAIPVQATHQGKSNEESVKIRKQADEILNVMIKKNDSSNFFVAKDLYTKSIAYAKPHSSALALAYANKSCIMFHMGKNEECLKDIDKALSESNYPDHLRPNLLRRKAKCLKKLGDNEGAKKVCEETMCLLENLSLDDKLKENLKTKINCIDDDTKNSENSKSSNLTEFPSFVPNSSIPSASEAVELSCDEKFGKRFVATRDVKVGEVLFIEKPYVSYVDIQNTYKYCNHCLNRIMHSVPCENCVYVTYCSEECKETAWKQYHDIECLIQKYLLVEGTTNTSITLKLALKSLREYESFEELKKEIDSKDYQTKGILHSDKYRSMYSLNAKKQSSYEKLCSVIDTALILYHVYKYTNLFPDSDKSISAICENQDALSFGRFVLLTWAIIRSTAYIFSDHYLNDSLNIAGVLFPVSSRLNHSCDPNVARCTLFKNDEACQVIYVLQPISKGSEILNNNGYTFLNKSKIERRKLIKDKFYFNCNCQACEESWPTFYLLPSINSIIDEKQKPKIYELLTNIKDFQEVVQEIKRDPSNYVDLRTVLQYLFDAITFMSEATKKPSKEFYLTIKLAKTVFTLLYCSKHTIDCVTD